MFNKVSARIRVRVKVTVSGRVKLQVLSEEHARAHRVRVKLLVLNEERTGLGLLLALQ